MIFKLRNVSSKWLVLGLATLLLVLGVGQLRGPAGSEVQEMPFGCKKLNKAAGDNIYGFTCNDIDGNPVSLEKYRGKTVLIVNVASKWGLTAVNYTQLVQLHGRYAPHLAILGFPCNQFGGQEPGTPQEIKDFIAQYGVQFDMFAKIKVNGDDADPLWNYLKSKQGGLLGNFIKWNFTKFLVDTNGVPVARYSPKTNPIPDIETDIKRYLPAEASQ